MIFERGYGMANLEHVPITPATVFDPVSIAKPFTALSVMLLAEQGKLSLDDEVWKHLPEWVNRGIALPSGTSWRIAPAPRRVPPHRVRAAGGAGRRHQRAHSADPCRAARREFRPVHRVQLQQWRLQPAREHRRPCERTTLPRVRRRPHLWPARHDASSFRGGPVAISPQHALGYHRDDRGFHLARDGGIDASAIVGNSGLFTTVGDLLRFAQNFGDARVGSRDHLNGMQTAVSLGANGTSPFGLGLEVGADGGLKTVGHGGGDRGIAAYLIRYPAHDLNVAVLCNLDNLNARVGTLARQVAALYLPARSEPVSREALPPPLDRR